MKPYVCTLLFEIKIEDFPHPQFDEQRLLVYATNNKKALKKVREQGQKESETFLNVKGKKVEWLFLGITEFICPSQNDIIPLNGNTYRPDDPVSFKKQKLAKVEYLYQQQNIKTIGQKSNSA